MENKFEKLLAFPLFPITLLLAFLITTWKIIKGIVLFSIELGKGIFAGWEYFVEYNYDFLNNIWWKIIKKIGGD